MKAFARERRKPGYADKFDVQHHPQRKFLPPQQADATGDKTAGFHSRPSHKRTMRNANRSMNKSARQRLKKDLTSHHD